MNFFKWLFGRKQEPVELPPEFLQENPPDWLIDLKGQGMPAGGPFSIRVQIVAAARTGSADIMLLPGDSGGEPKSASASLERTELDRLLVVLGFSFPADIGDVAGGAGDGPACTLTIHRREPYQAKAGECRLAEWIESKKPGPPVIEIGRILMELQRRVLPAGGS
jgi:hypothetical protein